MSSTLLAFTAGYVAGVLSFLSLSFLAFVALDAGPVVDREIERRASK